MTPFQQAKFWIVDHLGLSKDALHIHFGLLLYFALVLGLRWPARSWKPLAAVAAAALAGEVWDISDGLATRVPFDLWPSWHDVWNTCFWPLALVLLARYSAALREPAR